MKLFRTHFESRVQAHNLSREAFTVYAVSACQALQWNITYISPSGIIAHPPVADGGVAQEVTIRKRHDGIAIKSANRDNSLRDWGKNEKIVIAFKDAYREQQMLLTHDDLAYRYEVISPHQKLDDDVLEQSRYEAIHKEDGLLAIIRPVKGYAATPVILLINLLVFLIMIAAGVSPVEPKAYTILQWGGNYGPSVFGGEWWRLISCAFLHIGFVHLFMNMTALVYVGAFLEPLIGTRRFVLAYFITTLTASFLSLYIHPQIISAGASGAIFGIFGVLLSLLVTPLIPKDIRNRLLFLMGFYVVYNLLAGLKQGVDNAGHIGGLAGGLILGFLFYRSLRKQKAQNI